MTLKRFGRGDLRYAAVIGDDSEGELFLFPSPRFFFRPRLHAYFNKKKRAERTAYTTQLPDPERSHSVGYRTTEKMVRKPTEKVVRKPNDNRTARKTTRRDPPPQI